MRELILLLIILLSMNGCQKGKVDPATARQMIIHRNLGLAYLEENKLRDAAAEFQKLVNLAPEEPLGYANLGLTYLRMQQPEAAEKWLKDAGQIDSHHPEILLLLAKVYESTGREDEAISTLEGSVEKNPTHLRTLYNLAQYYLQTPDQGHKEKSARLLRAEEYLGQIVHALPANVAVRLELVELLLQNEKPAQALEHMETIRQILPELPEGSPEIFEKSLEFMREGNATQALTPARMFHNVLKSSSFYQAALIELKGKSGSAAEPLQRFSQEALLHSEQQQGLPSALSFTEVATASGFKLVENSVSADSSQNDRQIVTSYGDYDGDGDQDVFLSQWLAKEQTSRQYLFVNDNGVFSDSASQAGLSHEGRDNFACFADYDNDGYLDVFITNSKGDRLYHNTRERGFREVAAQAGIQTASSRDAHFVDLDLEGDLDLFIVGSGQNRFYRNNSDGTFTEIADEAGISGREGSGRDAAFGDFDDDGDLDLFVASQNGDNQYFDNLRQGYFREIAAHAGVAVGSNSGAVTTGDYDNDGYLDLFVTDLTGKQHSLYRNRGDGTFERDARSDSAFATLKGIAGFDAVFFDADNDGFLDLSIAGSASLRPAFESPVPRGLWLFHNNGKGIYSDASSLLPTLPAGGRQLEVTDYDNDGDLDIFMAGSQSIHVLRNDGGNVNNYLTLRLAGLRTGSGKNNYFGIGAKVEVKAGTLNQMHVMNEPVAHFGLGDQERAELVRVVWSNGVPQNWFDPERNQTIMEDQTLKGSCPWLYAWNGTRYEFVTDVLWTSALGMPLGIMGKGIGYAFANSGQDYFKIPGEMLLPSNEKYLLQFTSELWEASFVDQIQFLAVDHPESLEVFIDEKFTPPPYPALRVYAVADQRPPVAAHDDQGNDLLQKIIQRDGQYISNLIPGKYQGITEPHDLILDLGDLSQADSVFLFLHGWIFPTDASINVNISQGQMVKALPPGLQVINEKGDWQTVIENLGFPKGKNKTMVFDLSQKFPVKDFRIRIQTNMQVYWDHIFYATRVAAGPLRISDLALAAADLHYRGFSEVQRATPYSPHIPNYHLVATEPKWRDLTGLYTRYGDVRSLLAESDSKYVIMNAGDEMTLTFDGTQLPTLSSGWKRDYIFYNDGWVKDGDLNTAHGQTVAPLPFQGMSAYPLKPGESYPKDQGHQDYLNEYNTRKVTTEAFKRLVFEGKTKY